MEQIDVFAKAFVETHTADLEPDLSRELNFLVSILRSGFAPEGANQTTKEAPELWMYRVVTGNVSLRNSIPNVVNMLSIFLSLMMTNCSGERSFSVLKRVKNYLRSTMGQERMSNLALLSIENGMLNSLPMDEIISDFASLKARKKSF